MVSGELGWGGTFRMKYRSKWLAVPLLFLIGVLLVWGKSMTGDAGEQVKEYTLTGTGTHYEISVGDAAKKPVVIRMKDLQLTGKSAPVLEILGSADVKLMLEGENSIQAVTGQQKHVEPVISCEGSLEICGEGSLTVSGTYQDGIRVKKNLSMSSGTLDIKAGNNGTRSEKEVEISGGMLTIEAGNNGIKAQEKQREDSGKIEISGGEIHVTAGDDALEAGALVRISGGLVFLDAEDYLIHCDGEQELTQGCVFYEKQ